MLVTRSKRTRHRHRHWHFCPVCEAVAECFKERCVTFGDIVCGRCKGVGLTQDGATPVRIRKCGLPVLNEAAIAGESSTGYEDAAGKGPFECANCVYSDERDGISTCGQIEMLRYSKQPLHRSRRVVDPHGCCEYVKRRGKG